MIQLLKNKIFAIHIVVQLTENGHPGHHGQNVVHLVIVACEKELENVKMLNVAENAKALRKTLNIAISNPAVNIFFKYLFFYI